MNSDPGFNRAGLRCAGVVLALATVNGGAPEQIGRHLAAGRAEREGAALTCL